MGKANVGSRYAVPFCIKPERGQVSENLSKSPSKQSCDVLHDDVAGSNLANNSGILSPEPTSLARQAGPEADRADVLAGEAATDKIGSNSICGEAFSGKTSHIVIDGDAGPALCEDGALEWLDLTERDGSHSGSFKPEAEAANS
jgi:hypothetical protein